MLNIGFIGLGGMGRSQTTAFSKVKGCKVYGGADLSPQARKSFAVDFPKANVYEKYSDLLADQNIDGVVIAVPTYYHRQVGLAALNKKIPTLMEKPLARTLADCHKLIDAAERTGTLLMVGHCRRFDAVWGAWKRPVVKGDLGSPMLWRHAMAGPGPGRWFMDDKLGGGPLLDGAIHNYDFANWMWGDPQFVVASSINLVPEATAIDTATATIHYPRGNQLMVSWSWGTKAIGDALFDVIGPKAALRTGPGDTALSAADKKKHRFYHLARAKGKNRLIKAPMDASKMLQNQASHFLDCIAGKAQCQSPGQEAIKAVGVAEAILKAARKQSKEQVKW